MGYGRMGRLVESLAPEAGVDIVGRVDIDNVDRPDEWPTADVAIDFSIASAVPANARRLAARGTHLVIGTTGWQDEEEVLRRELAAQPIGVVFCAEFRARCQSLRGTRRGRGRKARRPSGIWRLDS